MRTSEHPLIAVEQLRIGLYIHLDLPWFKHPFAFSHFKIKSEEQLRTLRGLGLSFVRYNPDQSDDPPEVDRDQPAASDETPVADAQPAVSPYVLAALEAKRVMVERIRVQREAAARIENAFVDTAKTVREVEKNLFSRPAETLNMARKLVTQIADSILCAPELAIHVMGDKTGGEELYFHSLNVTMLSLMLARNAGVAPESMGVLGMGALFHDIGRKEIPHRILSKLEPLTQAEQHLYQMHCQYGAEIASRLQFDPAVTRIILEHHELFDGSGYPRALKGEAIGLLSRIVALTNHYDELCNPLSIANALTPHEALSIMFARQRHKFDSKLLQILVRCLGVYPPGTIVQLSNNLLGMVATVNTANPMKPMIVIYDADIPKDEAILVDLALESELRIAKAIRPAQVPREIYIYLSPRKRVSYYFDPGQPGKEKPAS